MVKRWREKLGNWILGGQHTIDLGTRYDKLPSDITTEAYSVMYTTPVVKELFKFLLSTYDQRILELADFKYNPMTTPNNLTHFMVRRMVEIKDLKARSALITHFLTQGKKFQSVIKMKRFKDNLKNE